MSTCDVFCQQQWLMGLFVSNRKEYISCHLEIDSSLHADAGQYKVTLENKLGAASAAINVKVIGTQPHASGCVSVTWTSPSGFPIDTSLCPQGFLVHVRRYLPRRSQRAPVNCPGIPRTTTAAARSSTMSCRSGMRHLTVFEPDIGPEGFPH